MSPTLVTTSRGALGGGGYATSIPFTCNVGDVFVVRATSGGVGIPATPTDSSGTLTFFSQALSADAIYHVWTATCLSPPGGPITITVLNSSGNGYTINIFIEQWRGGQVAESSHGANTDVESGTGTASVCSITSAVAGSVISWGATTAVATTANSFVTSSATPTVIRNGHGDLCWAYQATPGGAGVQAYGVTSWDSSGACEMIAVEIQPGPVVITDADTGSGTEAMAAAAALPSSDTGSGLDAASALVAVLASPDICTGVEAGAAAATLVAPDIFLATEAVSLAATLSSPDSFAASDTGAALATLSGGDASLGPRRCPWPCPTTTWRPSRTPSCSCGRGSLTETLARPKTMQFP